MSLDSTRTEKQAHVKHFPFLFPLFAEDNQSILRVRQSEAWRWDGRGSSQRPWVYKNHNEEQGGNPPALLSPWLAVTSQHTHPLQVPQGRTSPAQPSQGSQVTGSPPTGSPSKHPSTFRFMSRETGVRRKKWQWSLMKASHGYGHRVVSFACGVTHHIAMASTALCFLVSWFGKER